MKISWNIQWSLHPLMRDIKMHFIEITYCLRALSKGWLTSPCLVPFCARHALKCGSVRWRLSAADAWTKSQGNERPNSMQRGSTHVPPAWGKPECSVWSFLVQSSEWHGAPRTFSMNIRWKVCKHCQQPCFTHTLQRNWAIVCCANCWYGAAGKKRLSVSQKECTN